MRISSSAGNKQLKKESDLTLKGSVALITAGVDIGSTVTKVVILDKDIRASVIGPTGAEHRRLAIQVMEKALDRAKVAFKDVAYVVAKGYGRINVPFSDE